MLYKNSLGEVSFLLSVSANVKIVKYLKHILNHSISDNFKFKQLFPKVVSIFLGNYTFSKETAMYLTCFLTLE